MKRVIVQFAIDASGWRLFHRLCLVLLLLPLIATPSDPARAGDAETASAAVDLFVKAGQTAGLPITDAEATIVKQVITCAVGDGHPSMGDCAKNALIVTALQKAGVTDPTVQNVVTCLTGGTSPVACGADALVKNLPVEAQPMASCMINGQGNVADCGKKLAEGVIIDHVPPDFQNAAKCMVESGNAQKCGSEFVVQQITSKLDPSIRDQAAAIVGCLGDSAKQAGSCVATAAAPDAVKPLVACATAQGADVGKCMTDFAQQNLPPGTPQVAKDMLGCAGTHDFVGCAGQKGLTDATNAVVSNPDVQKSLQDALDTMNKLRPDAPMTIDAGVNSGNMATVQNILKVAQGIKDKDWSEVALGAGPELAIIASDVLLQIFLTPALASALGPAVDAMIHNDAAAAQNALNAISKGDVVGLMQVAFTWYETQFIDKPCALMGDNDVKNTICGGLSDAIKDISNAGGDVANKLLGMGEDVLKWLGVWGTVDDVATFAWNTLKGAVDDVAHFFGIGGSDDHHKWVAPADCSAPGSSPKDYFANNYLTCVVAEAANTHANNGLPAQSAGMNALDGACQKAMGRCLPPDKQYMAQVTCSQMGLQLAVLGGQVASAMGRAADAYNKIGLPAWMAAQFKSSTDKLFGAGSRDFCNPAFWNAGTKDDYVNTSSCASFVNQQFPGVDGKTPQACPMSIAGNGAAAACMTSISISNDIAGTGAGDIAASLVGPDGVFCKAQQQWQASHHCRPEPPIQVRSPTGQVIATLVSQNLRCEPDWMQQARSSRGLDSQILGPPKTSVTRPSWADIGPGVFIPKNLPLSSSGSNQVGPNFPNIPVTFPAPGELGHGPAVPQLQPPPLVRPPFNVGNPWKPPAILGGLPPSGGGSSGISETNSCSGNSPAAGCPPQSGDAKKPPPIVGGLPKGGGGSSGVSTVNGCSGNSPAAGCPPPKSSTAGLPKSGGGSSGISEVNSNSNTSGARTRLAPFKDGRNSAGLLPKGGGGSSGVSMVNGCSGNSPAAGCAPPSPKVNSAPFKSGLGSAGLAKGGGGSSGVSMVNGNSGNMRSNTRTSPFKDTSRSAPVIAVRPPVNSSGSNSAMDRLGGGSIGSVSGGGGTAGARKSFSGSAGGSSNRYVPPPPRNNSDQLIVR